MYDINFRNDVHAGLSQLPKVLSSKYFYDRTGDALFVRIMQLPEYYLTRAEMEIFEKQGEQLVKEISMPQHAPFELIELGAGDGLKTKKLIASFLKLGYRFKYIPIDISANALEKLQATVNEEFPEIDVEARNGDYFKILKTLKDSHRPKLILFLGSSIGNMSDVVAADFMKALSRQLNEGDKILLGLDLIKTADIVLPAYDDEAGITKAFNFNLLHRINEELDADFDLDNFVHAPEYTQEEGIARSFLVSKKEQSVTVQTTGKTYHFGEGEKLQTEMSRKYNSKVVEKILSGSALEVEHIFTDSNGYFSDYLLAK